MNTRTCLWIGLSALVLSCAPTESNPRDAAVDAQLPRDVFRDAGASADADSQTTEVEPALCSGPECSDASTCEGPACGACVPACDAPAPVCTGGECGACTRDSECADFSGTPHCVEGACVACGDNSDCSASRSVCDPVSHTCQACAADATGTGPDADCAHLTDTPVCVAGSCVACTAQKRTACGANVCNALTHSCAQGSALASANVCEPCVSDAQCKAGQLCVQRPVPGAEPKQMEGWFCQTVQNAQSTPRVLCSSQRPYTSEFSTGSIDAPNTLQTVCSLRTATCGATQKFSTACGRYDSASASVLVTNITQAADGTPLSPEADASAVHPDNTACGVGGKCIEVNASLGVYQCSVACFPGSDNDCLSSLHCIAVASDHVCSLSP